MLISNTVRKSSAKYMIENETFQKLLLTRSDALTMSGRSEENQRGVGRYGFTVGVCDISMGHSHAVLTAQLCDSTDDPTKIQTWQANEDDFKNFKYLNHVCFLNHV